jgi:hypothetical protein
MHPLQRGSVLEFHARLHGSEVIALNDADACATAGAYFCVSAHPHAA